MNFKDPIRPFLKEHEYVLEQTHALEDCLDELRTKGYSKPRAARFAKALEAVEHEVRVHNTVEERALLNVLDQTLPHQGPTFIMRQEYSEFRRVARRLKYAFQSLQGDTRNKKKLAMLRLTAEWLIKLLQEHIGKGNAVLFPLAKRVLTAQQMREVAQRFKSLTAAT